MGYVLPVAQFQYKDYQNRVTKDKSNPFYIERPYKSILEVQYQDIANEYSTQEKVQSQRDQPILPKSKVMTESIYNDVTGKGQFFSESV